MSEARPQSEEKMQHAKTADSSPAKKQCARTMTRAGNRSVSILAYKRPQTNMLCCLQSSFGKDAPKISIGCSRPQPVFPNRDPGPGAYTPKDPGESRKIYHQIPKAVDKPIKSETADINFINYRVFPKIRPQTICKTGHQDYFSFDPNIPGPVYDPPSTFSNKGHKIEPLRTERKIQDSTPGPGYYSPKDDPPKGSFFYTTSPRNTDHYAKSIAPGPGTYNPNFYAELSVQPRWSIGKKGRFRKRRKCDPPEVPKGKLIGISSFLVQLDPSMNESDVLKFVANHPELKLLITEVIDQILVDKPENPLGYIREYFMALKARRVK